jgi:hypothetical protein
MNWCRDKIGMWAIYLSLISVLPVLPSCIGFTLIHPVAIHQDCCCHAKLQLRQQSRVCIRSFENAHILRAAFSTNQPELDDDIDEDNNNSVVDVKAAENPFTVSQQPSIKRRRRRRKEEDNIDNVAKTPSETAAVSPEVVTIPIMDVRRLVDTSSTVDSNSVAVFAQTKQQERNLPLQNQLSKAATTSSSATTHYDPLEQLLIDAKEMRSMRRNSATDGNDLGQLENGKSGNNDSYEVSTTSMSVSKVLSTIVIVDFFIVLVFFLWFLLGIVASYTIKNDAIQIAFNSNFQTLVQPALGILMIASISDAVFKEKEE